VLCHRDHGLEERPVVVLCHAELAVVSGKLCKSLLGPLQIVQPFEEPGELTENGRTGLRHRMLEETAQVRMGCEQTRVKVFHRGMRMCRKIGEQFLDQAPVKRRHTCAGSIIKAGRLPV
jgi:hypothetical protein